MYFLKRRKTKRKFTDNNKYLSLKRRHESGRDKKREYK